MGLFFKPRSVWRRGEDAATRFMLRRGCRVLARNLRLPAGEIDLLCVEKSSGTLVIVEVKAREYALSSRVNIDPTASITRAKRAKLRTLARALQKRPEYGARPIRIDVISVRFARGRRRLVAIDYFRAAVGGA